MRRALIAAGFAALVLGGAQTAHAGIALNTIDKHVTYDRDGGRVRSTGPIGCTRGERVAIEVRISQTSGARARGRWSGPCTGDAQHWRVRARARDEKRFASGSGRVCAVARTRADGRVTDTRRWCGRVSVAAERGAWGASVRLDLGARELGLGAGASERALARAAIGRSAERLRLPRRGGLRFAYAGTPGGDVPDARTLTHLRFQQTLGGLRVLWSDIDVAIADGRVSSITATTVPLASRRPAGRRRVSARRAVAIARRAVAGSDRALPAQPVAYAGSPVKPRPARRAYVVQVTTEERNLCVVVDAETGKVLATWRGTAALPRARTTATAAQLPTTVLFQLTNYKRQPGENGYAYGKLRQLVSTTGFPTSYRTDVTQLFDVFDQKLAWLAPWIEDVTRYFCLTRKYCGRDSAGDGSYNRWFMVGNYGSEATSYSYADEHVLIGANDADDPDVLAHEIGHAIDHHFDGGEYQQTIEGEEVKEALADMYSYDQDRDGRLQDGANPSTPAGSNPDDGSIIRDFANPGSVGDAAKYSQYDCFTTDDHDNGTILSHAYHRFVSKAGHAKAGHVLQFVPWSLPARREFGDVRVSFEIAARDLFPNGGKYEGSVEQKVDQAFDEVGVFAATRRTSKCKGAQP